MANSRTLIVYVLALVVGCPSSFWVNASTSPILPSSQFHHPQQQQNGGLQQPPQPPQHHQDASVASPPSSPVLGAQQPALSQQSTLSNQPPKMTVKNGWGLSAGTSRSGPYTSGYSYISGRTLDAPPPYVYMTDNDLAEQPASRTSTMLNGIGSGLNGLFGNTFDWKSAAFGGLFTLGAQYFDLPGTMFPGIFPVSAATPTRSSVSKETTKATEKVDKISLKSNVTSSNSTILSRRRRSIEADTDLTNLASMVLSAIQSGECMQKSICLLGTQIGASNKGRLAFTLVDKLIPEAVQGNQYFVTLKKALLKSGDSFCEKFHCKLH